ncbi:MAG: ABC transporter permease [Spirosomaceae bacterium]|jgi:putative ABC transport system permease protein|nr:ABC transporter permease [Spirosomataceae bacterium]
MIRNYLKIAFRNLFKNKVYSFINITGLALGLAVSMLILLYVSHEVSFDKFHTNHERIFQVGGQAKIGEQEINFSNMSGRLGDAMKEATPLVEDVGRKSDEWEATFETTQRNRATEKGMIFADEGFFRIFNFKILQGNPKELSNPYTIFLTPKMALKYFGNENPLGKTIRWNKKVDLKIVGIVEKNPSNSSIEFNFIASLPTKLSENKKNYPQYYTESKINQIGTGDYETFLLLDNPQSQANVQTILTKIAADNPNNEVIVFNLNHFANHLGLKGEQNGTNSILMYVYIFSAIAVLILLLALINFMNLTTARATTRAKEVGVRKSIGANQNSLATQFYIESTLMLFISLIFAILLFQVLRPTFYKILDLQIDTAFLMNPYFIGSIVGIIVISALLAGSYPSFVLSKYNPIEVLKGKIQGRGNVRIRQSLTVFQLVVSSTLIFCSTIIYFQISKMRNKNLGLNKDNILTINLDGKARGQNQALITQIKQIDGVQGVSGSQHRIFFEGYNMFSISKVGEKDPDKNVGAIVFNVDVEYINLFEIDWKIKPQQLPSDLKKKVLLNETAAKGLDNNIAAIKNIEMSENESAEVIGVLKDFNYLNLKNKVMPAMLTFITDSRDFGFLNIKLRKDADVVATMAKIEKAYNDYKVEDPFVYHFADETFDKMFKSEDRLANIFGAFTGIAIFIACLGLFGLITFVAEQKTKEIGVRKVLGATILNITTLLSTGFLKLVLIATFIAVPIAYYAMNRWLQDFNYRINISWWMFALGGFGVTIIALLTVSYQAIKAATMNPAKSLKTE